MNGIAKLVCAVAVFLSGCCLLRPCPPVVHAVEVYGVSGFGAAPFGPLPTNRFSRRIQPGQEVVVWFRASYVDNVRKAAPATLVHISVVDALGNPDAGGTVTPASTVTSSQGHNCDVVRFQSSAPGIYRVKFTYADKQSTGVAYSPPIIVMSGP